ncbi:bifunctional metallophosphatase/5'-nucleotidase [Paucibacter sp. R3-3]|uniref:Bifunctional metallophosphatase/5'-nucleotidase n=1 Tax=Roseateles agri TaxID=3098619 RepID=A0ABU5DMD3_9BURK|nr:bifunctional metallophosphatase/5'-nucleotidase [Paucibacter sp. R3-3]MDY0746850.1 bifunctional metallophosphatase/5'-nucleotidase [Paucibacter sp. R3-3]
MNASLLSRALALAASVWLAGCATAPAPTAAPRTLTLLSINDFHGFIQSRAPVPAMLRLPEADGSLGKPAPAGGIPYLAAALDSLRAEHPGALVVAAGDLIGASPQNSALLADEPSLVAFDKLGIVASALGNHELDGGLPALQDKLAGRCPAGGCPLPGYAGVHFPYLAANLVETATGKHPFRSYVIREVDGLKLAFVGVVTKNTPSVSLPRNMEGLRFSDEAETLNALVPELRAKGAQVLVAVMHEGAEWRGPANDPTYACTGLGGRGVDIAHRLSPEYAMIVSGHSHMAYTCKVDGRLLVQAGSFGAWITQTTLKVDGQGHVLDAQAVNVPVLQSRYTPAPAFAALEAEAEKLTEPVRLRPIATVAHGLRRTPADPLGDAGLGNLIADSQAAYARAHDTAQTGPIVALMNLGGIRTDLEATPARPVNLSELTAIQPFHNDLVALTLSGAQLRELLTSQLPRGTAAPRLLQPSSGLRYTWARAADGSARLVEVKIDGQPLDDARNYRVVANGFMADGGEGLTVMRQGRDRTVLGVDLDAMLEYLAAHPEAVDQVEPGRIRRVE